MTMLSGENHTRKRTIPAAVSGFVAVAHRWLDWMGYFARWRVTIYIITVAVACYGVLMRCSGLGRSLWLDEAWVANSVAAPSLRGMFYYNTWLQSSPPLFLLPVRASVALFGPSNAVFRALPLLMGILALLSLFLLVARILSRPFALLAWTLLVLSPAAIDYSRELKQYSSELAASATILLVCTLYIENATVRRFWLLVATVVAGLLIGYGVAFVLPGIILLVCMLPIRYGTPSDVGAWTPRPFVRAFFLAAAAGGTLVGEYFLLVAPNSPAVLRAAWAKKNTGIASFTRQAASEGYRLIAELPLNHLLRRQGIVLSVVGIIIIVGLSLAWLRFRKGRRKWLDLQAVCLLPCLLLIVSDWFSWYPFTERTSLFALPFVIVIVMSSLQLAYFFVVQRRRNWLRPLLDVVLLCAIAITIHAGRRNFASLSVPREDVDGAVSFLKAHVQSGDFLWVHASCSEAFKLYASMSRWQDAPVRYGHTGWPCCPRGIDNASDTSTELLVRNDFGGALPIGFHGTAWLLYTMRPEHWQQRANEPQIMQTILRERGCVEMPTPPFNNLGVGSFDCKEQAVTTPVIFDPSVRKIRVKQK